MGAIERELTALRNSTSWAIDRRRVDEAWAELATLRADIARLRADNQRLKDALFFWLPNIPAIENECTERMANDAALLIGHEGRIDDSAEQRGWITLSPNVELSR